ncbi:LysR family transcriptional regulator [Pseudonocardia sp. DLS-67]
MELRQMQVIVAVAEAGGFSAAGRRLRLVQSAVSTTVRAVERELDVPLFDRSTHRVVPTAAGEAFVAAARTALSAADQVHAAVAAARGVLRGRVTLGVMQGLLGGLPPAIAALRHAHPGVVVRLRQAPPDEIVDAVREGAVDLAVIALARRPRGLAGVELMRDRMVALVGPHSDLPAAPVTLSELSRHPFVDIAAGWAIRQVVDRAFRAAGVDRAGVFETNDILAAAELVRTDLGVTVFPATLAAGFPDLRTVAIRNAPTWTVRVVHRRGPLVPATAALLEHLERAASRR